MSKYRVNFVCLGNICRSPMAEFIAADMLKKQGLSGAISVYSSAISNEEEGCPVYPRALKKLNEEGVPTYQHFANAVTKDMYGEYDLFVCMEEYQCRRLRLLFAGDPEQKVQLLMSYTGNPTDVADPWYSGDFETAYSQIKYGVAALIFQLQADLNA